MGGCENALSACLAQDKIAPVDLQDAIGSCKVKAIEAAIKFCFALKQEVGSYALMGGTGFDRLDYLQCCKFAEGDSRILMQKIARDRMTQFKKGPGEGAAAEVALCQEIAGALMEGGPKAWN